MSIIDQLIALINSANVSEHPSLLTDPLTIDQVSISNPTPDAGLTWDTKVTVSALPNSEYSGQVDVFYNRIDLSAIGTDLGFMSETPFTADTVVSILNAMGNVALLDTDMGEFTIPNMNVGDIETVVLVANPDSLAWKGTVTVSLLFGLPPNVSILHQLMTVTLPSAGYLT